MTSNINEFIKAHINGAVRIFWDTYDATHEHCLGHHFAVAGWGNSFRAEDGKIVFSFNESCITQEYTEYFNPLGGGCKEPSSWRPNDGSNVVTLKYESARSSYECSPSTNDRPRAIMWLHNHAGDGVLPEVAMMVVQLMNPIAPKRTLPQAPRW